VEVSSPEVYGNVSEKFARKIYGVWRTQGGGNHPPLGSSRDIIYRSWPNKFFIVNGTFSWCFLRNQEKRVGLLFRTWNANE